MFGGARRLVTRGTHTFVVTGSLVEAYDDNIFDRFGVNQSPGTLPARPYTALTGSLDYGRQTSNFAFDAVAGGDSRYDHRLEDVVGVAYHGSALVAANLGRSARFFATQRVVSSTSYLSQLFPGSLDEPVATSGAGAIAFPASGINFAVSNQRALSLDTSTGFDYSLTRRSSLRFTSGLQHSTFQADSRMQSYFAGGGYSRALTRNAKFHLGYAYRNAQYLRNTGTREIVMHYLDAGVDFNRPVSASRRTFIALRTGSSISRDQSDDGPEPTNVDVSADVSLTHQIARTWQTALTYHHGLQFVTAVFAPVYSDGLETSIHGMAGRRVDLKATVGVSTGEIRQGPGSAERFETYTGITNIRFAVNRFWAVYGEYVYYYYDMGNLMSVAPGVPVALQRQGIRLGLTLWAPVVRR